MAPCVYFTRGIVRRHSLQLFGFRNEMQTDVFQRSVFGVVRSHNALPQWHVDISTVKGFQRELQRAVLSIAELGYDGWQRVLSRGVLLMNLLDFQSAFVTPT